MKNKLDDIFKKAIETDGHSFENEMAANREKLWNQIEKPKPVKLIPRYWQAIAAGLTLLLMGSSICIFSLLNQKNRLANSNQNFEKIEQELASKNDLILRQQNEITQLSEALNSIKAQLTNLNNTDIEIPDPEVIVQTKIEEIIEYQRDTVFMYSEPKIETIIEVERDTVFIEVEKQPQRAFASQTPKTNSEASSVTFNFEKARLKKKKKREKGKIQFEHNLATKNEASNEISFSLRD